MVIVKQVEKADVVCGLAWGDEAKGKIVSELLKTNKYDWVCRYSGGSNAGHTIYVNGEKYTTHIVPAGVFYGVNCYIGRDCYVNITDLEIELEYLQNNGFDISVVKISPMAHIITSQHKEEDLKKYKSQQGSTGKGIAPCASDKYARKGINLKTFVENDNIERIFSFRENMLDESELYGNILCEGAQGCWLDINYGNYPYVTSSNTLPFNACSLGFPPQCIRHIYGAAKIYDTRVGIDPDFSDELLNNNDLSTIAIEGNEFGSTTGRARKVNWLNLDKLIQAINITGTTHVIISKLDVLEKLKLFNVYYNNKLLKYDSMENMISQLKNLLMTHCKFIQKIIFSSSAQNVNFF